MAYIRDENNRVIGGRRPVRVKIVEGSDSEISYPETVTLIPNTGGTSPISGTYTATDNVNVTVLLSDSDSSNPATFTGYLQLESFQRIQIPAIRITGTVEEIATAQGNTIVQYGVPAGFTLIVEATRSVASTVSVKGTVST